MDSTETVKEKEHKSFGMKEIINPLNKATERMFSPARLRPNDFLEVSMTKDGNILTLAYAKSAYNEGEKVSASNAGCRSFMKMPERRYSGWGKCILKPTDINALAIRCIWPTDRVIYLDDESKELVNMLVLRFAEQSISAKKKALFKLKKVMPSSVDSFVDHPKNPLMDYQLACHNTSYFVDGVAEFMDPGCGKSAIVVSRVSTESRVIHKKEKRAYRSIIVCPQSVRVNWRREFEKFSTTKGRIVVLHGTALDRMKQLAEVLDVQDDDKWLVVICSYETLSRSWEVIRLFDWDLAVADESHMFKQPTTQRYKTMQALRDRSKCRVILTGTEVGNIIGDLYTQLEFLGKGYSGFSSYKAFCAFYHVYSDNEGRDGHRRVSGFQNIPILQERISRLAFQMTKKEALPNLPKQMFDIQEVMMTPQQMEVYTNLQVKLAAQIESQLDNIDSMNSSNYSITVSNILTKLLRLSQISSGFTKTDDLVDDNGDIISKGKIVYFDRIPKIDKVIEIIKEKTKYEKVIIWCCWVPAIEEISRRLNKANIKHVTYYGKTKQEDRETAQISFNNDPTVKVFLGNQSAGGSGMNLPGYVPEWEGTDKDTKCNASHVIYYCNDWSHIKREQSQNRNHGKSRNRVPIQYTDIICPGSIDEEILTRLTGKKITALDVKDIRGTLKRIIGFDVKGQE